MSKYLKYWPVLLIIAAFISGRFSAPDHSKELEKLREEDRKKHEQAMTDLYRAQALKFQDYEQQINGLKKDTTDKGIELRGFKRSEAYHRKLYEKINLRMAAIPELDSLRAALRSPLHSNR